MTGQRRQNWIVPEGILELQPREFNPKKHFLGDVCDRGHEFQDGKGLRYIKGGACVECLSIASKQKQTRPPLIRRETWIKWTRLNHPEIPEKYFLGSSCFYGHTFNDTPYCLRFVSAGSCYQCCSEKAQTLEAKAELAKWRAKNKEHVSAYNSHYWQENYDFISTRRQEYRKNNPDIVRARDKKYRLRHRDKRLIQYKAWEERNKEYRVRYRRIHYVMNAERRRLYGREYGKKHRDRIREKNKLRYKTDPLYRMRVKANSARREARKASNHIAFFTPSQLKERLDTFDGCCSYCGIDLSIKGVTWDHFIPVSKGGSESIGNLVPACLPCNSSKWTKDAFEWFKSQPFFRVARWRKILKVLGKTQSNYTQLPFL